MDSSANNIFFSKKTGLNSTAGKLPQTATEPGTWFNIPLAIAFNFQAKRF
jgi:hypothetical protein